MFVILYRLFVCNFFVGRITFVTKYKFKNLKWKASPFCASFVHINIVCGTGHVCLHYIKRYERSAQ